MQQPEFTIPTPESSASCTGSLAIQLLEFTIPPRQHYPQDLCQTTTQLDHASIICRHPSASLASPAAFAGFLPMPPQHHHPARPAHQKPDPNPASSNEAASAQGPEAEKEAIKLPYTSHWPFHLVQRLPTLLPFRRLRARPSAGAWETNSGALGPEGQRVPALHVHLQEVMCRRRLLRSLWINFPTRDSRRFF